MMGPIAARDWARYEMWQRLIPCYMQMDKNEKKRAKRAYAAEDGKLPHEIQGAGMDTSFIMSVSPSVEFSLGGSTTATTTYNELVPYIVGNKKANKENNMFNEFDYDGNRRSETSMQRDYLASRLSDLSHEKRQEISRTFGLVDDASPNTINELIERIKAGKYTIDEDKGDKDTYSPMAYLNWRDPSVKKDEKGANVALKALGTAQEAVTDIIAIKSADDGLTAVQEFAAKTFH